MIDRDGIREHIKALKTSGILCIVEGKKDVAALSRLGIQNVISLRAPLYKVVEEIAARADCVAILTDLDGKGKELHHTLYRDLQKHGVKIDNALREKLFREKVSHIEGLDTILC